MLLICSDSQHNVHTTSMCESETCEIAMFVRSEVI